MSPHTNRRLLQYCVAAVAVAGFGIVLWHFYKHRPASESNPVPMSFDDTSEKLRQTVVVPTLDSPIPEGKSAIWCASFQYAWNRLKDDLAKEPIRLADAQQIADRLNRADQSEEDVEENSVYAAAGMVKDGIVRRIRADMARKFPSVPRPEFDVPADGGVAYAYLAASSKYEYPYFENDERFVFTDSEGHKTEVGSFGIRKKDDYSYDQLRGQVEVLYCPSSDIWFDDKITEFILDPCKTSKPYQIVLARVDRKDSLADTLADVERKIASKKLHTSKLGPRDIVLIPNMSWRINHHFRELEGKDKQFLNPALQGLYLDAAIQTIQFRLNRSGAELASEAKVYVKPGVSYFQFNYPFLLIMKKRDSKNPFLVLWIENAELFEKK